jgi:hypothetical protein
LAQNIGTGEQQEELKNIENLVSWFAAELGFIFMVIFI